MGGLFNIAGMVVGAQLVTKGRIENPFTPGMMTGLERAVEGLTDLVSPPASYEQNTVVQQEDEGYTPPNAAEEAAEMADLNRARVCEAIFQTCEVLDSAGIYEAVFEFSPWAILGEQDSWATMAGVVDGYPGVMTPEGYSEIEKPQGLQVARRAYWALVDQLYLTSVAYSVSAYFDGISVDVYECEHEGYWTVVLGWEPDHF